MRTDSVGEPHRPAQRATGVKSPKVQEIARRRFRTHSVGRPERREAGSGTLAEGLPAEVAQRSAADDKADVHQPVDTRERESSHQIEAKYESDKASNGHAAYRHCFGHVVSPRVANGRVHYSAVIL